MPRIIFITTLTLWSMGKGHGGPAFTKTVEKYIDEGWEVYLISDEPSNIDYPGLNSQHNIFLSPTPFKKYGHIRKLGLLFRWLDHKVMTKKMCDAAKPLLQSTDKRTVLYAYEVFGVEACRRLSSQCAFPLVARFQGSLPVNTLDRFLWYQKIARYPHCQAVSQKADLVIMTDDGSLGDVVLKKLSNHSPLLFLRNGLDLMNWDVAARIAAFNAEAFRSSLGIRAEETMFLTVSRLVSWKRVERVIDGFAAFCRSGKAGKLVIVGDGTSRKGYAELAASLGLANQVIFTGSVAHDQVYDYMMAADVFVSLYDQSNVGNPLLEAMTLGKCIITLDVGDTQKMIHDRENGILLTMDTLPTLGTVMQELSENHGLRQQLGDAAARYAQENFYTWEKRMEIEYQTVSALLEEKET